jgi:hypothetical protein
MDGRNITPIPLGLLRNAATEAGFIDIEFQAAAPPVFSGLTWWKMRLLGWAIQRASGRRLWDGDILFCQGAKPR